MQLAHCDQTRSRVHLINPLWDPNGGSDWRTIDTWRLLRSHADVRIWSEYSSAEAFAPYPIERIRPLRFSFPRDGTFVAGAYSRARSTCSDFRRGALRNPHDPLPWEGCHGTSDPSTTRMIRHCGAHSRRPAIASGSWAPLASHRKWATLKISNCYPRARRIPRDGINARLITCTREAIERVTALEADAAEAARLGAAARRHAVTINAEELPRRTVALLTHGGCAAYRRTEAQPATI
jgi:hypothetical protein